MREFKFFSYMSFLLGKWNLIDDVSMFFVVDLLVFYWVGVFYFGFCVCFSFKYGLLLYVYLFCYKFVGFSREISVDLIL